MRQSATIFGFLAILVIAVQGYSVAVPHLGQYPVLQLQASDQHSPVQPHSNSSSSSSESNDTLLIFVLVLLFLGHCLVTYLIAKKNGLGLAIAYFILAPLIIWMFLTRRDRDRY